jgi:hypothetical protein
VARATPHGPAAHTYVVADERDVVRLRTNYRGEDVYVYRLDAPPAGARLLLLRYL